MAERLKRAAAWLGLVTDDRYAEYDEVDGEQTEGISREELRRRRPDAAAGGVRSGRRPADRRPCQPAAA